MQSQLGKLASWFVGLMAVVAIVWYFRPEDFAGMVRAVGVAGILGWTVATLAARIAHGETTVAPLAALGHPIRRTDVFWIGWVRTFASQVLPLSGIAAYAQAVRAKTRISWSSLAALATPQFVLAATALGVIGCTGVLLNTPFEGGVKPTLLAIYVGVIVASLLIATGAAGIIERLPFGIAERASQTAQTLRELSGTRGLLAKLVFYHLLVIVFRGVRLWMLFELVGVSLTWEQAILLVAVAESTMLIQLTPGGLGLREGAILGGAALVGVGAPAAAGVALIDRLLVIAITALLTPPSLRVLRSDHGKQDCLD